MKFDNARTASKVLVLSEKWETAEPFAQRLLAMGLQPLICRTVDRPVNVPHTSVAGVVLITARYETKHANICRRFREQCPGAFVVAVLEDSGEDAESRALRAGVDQCLPESISPELFDLRISALLTRIAAGEPAALLWGDVRRFGCFEFDIGKNLIQAFECSTALTGTEGTILELLSRSPGRPVGRSAISYAIWGWDSDTYEEHLKCHVSRLRIKIRNVCGCCTITTIRGRGYCFMAREESEDRREVPVASTGERCKSRAG